MMGSLARRQLFALCCLLGYTLLLPVSLAQEDDDDDDDRLEVTAYFEDGVANEAEDIAVAAVYHQDLLYVVATTEGALEDGNAGGVDFIVKAFDPSELEEEITLAEQFGGSGDDIVTAIVANEETTDIVIVGSTSSDSGDDHLFDLTFTGATDWFIAMLEFDSLEVRGAYVNGSRFEDQEATAVAVTSDGDFVVAGWTWGSYFGDNAGEDNSENEIGYDTWVLKISEDLDPNDGDYMWNTQFGTVAYDVPTAMIIDSSGNVYVAGTTTDENDVVDDANSTQSMFVYCLDGDTGETIWSVTTDLGSLVDESAATGLVFSEDESELYLAGNTLGVIPGFDGESTGEQQLFIVSLDIDDGTTNWVYQSESPATAFGSAGIVLADDGMPIIGGYAFGNQFNLTGDNWVSSEGADMIAAKIDVDDLEVVKYFVVSPASNLTDERPLAMVKDPDVDDGVYLLGWQDGQFEEEVEDDSEVSYLVVRIELEELPEEEEDDDDSGYDFAYWPIGVGLTAFGAVLFAGTYKWAEHSERQKANLATMV